MEVKQLQPAEAVHTLPVTIPATGVIPNTLRAVLKQVDLQDLLFVFVTIQRYIVLNTFNKAGRFLSDNTLQQ